jgi:(1->4)-alpha-D-glucan 1-alpha-D-glucosylmutase
LQEEDVPDFRSRVSDFMVKAAREAKATTSWLSPDTAYEEALVNFTQSILTEPGSRKFLKDFRRFQKISAHFGALNSLAQLLLKIGAPGVPDFYQGNELWEFSLVDPDNRRSVDFKKRSQMLEELKRLESEGRLKLARQLLHDWEDGRIKLYVTFTALGFRKAKLELFLEGEYIPLEPSGPHAEHVCAFARRKGKDWAAVVAPRLLSRLIKPGEFPVGKKVWGAGLVTLPREAPKRWRNVFTHETVTAAAARRNKVLPLDRVFRHFPVAFLTSDF